MTDPAENETPAQPEVKKDFTYLHERLKPLGWTEENNLFEAERTAIDGTRAAVMVKVPLFDADEDGNVLINYYDLRGNQCSYKTGGSRWSKPYVLKRLRSPRFDAEGKEHKYEIPKGAGTFPWIPPNVMQCYRDAWAIDTLVLTEGAIKAFSAYVRGMYIVGLTSISHYRDRAVETLHHDILEVIKRCKPKNVVWLVDGDCKSLTKDWQKVIQNEGKDPSELEKLKLPDLARKPNLFLSSAINIRELLKDYGVDVYFAHIQSDSVAGNPKGLDDLFLAYRELKGAEAEKAATQLVSTHKNGKPLDEKAYQKELKKAAPGIALAKEKAMADADAEVVQDLLHFSNGQPRFFHRMNITGSASRLRAYFGLNNKEQFYQTYTELIGEREFSYIGTIYKWNPTKGELEMQKHADAEDYAQVGDYFYEWVPTPRLLRDGTEVLERVMENRRVATIKRNYGDWFIKQIPQYKKFVNIPNHRNYQQVVHNCRNLYHPVEHVAEEGECKEVLDFMEHIAGSGTIKARHPVTGLEYQVKELDVFLDYIQIGWEKPTHILPIFCPVSKRRNTGKSTLLKFIKAIYGMNAVFVGNADFENDFNALWAWRNYVMCEESFIDKKKVIERVKTLSTADRISVNAKGKDQIETDFFAKFILASNNEENFANVESEEVRFWVRQIPEISEKDLNVRLETIMREQIPQFLNFLNNRKLATEKLYRHWFDPKLLMTDALRRVMEQSKPQAIKELHTYLRELFYRTRREEILMDADDVQRWVFNGSTSKERTYLNRLIADDMKISRYRRESDLKEVTKEYDFPVIEYSKDHSTGNYTRKQVIMTGNGRPFVFKREDFISREEWEAHVFEDPIEKPSAPGKQAVTAGDDDLPF